MALFSLLLALMIERTISLGPSWSLSFWLVRCHQRLASVFERTSESMALLIVVLPSALLWGVLHLLEGVAFGLFNLIIWVVVTLLGLVCCSYRARYKAYLLSVCHQDVQGSYHHAADLLDVESLKVSDPCMLATRVGRQLAWINYRYYCAVLLMMIIGGPVAVLFYATLRTLDMLAFKQTIVAVRWVNPLLFVLDWLPARIVAFAYALVGNFSNAIPLWISLSLHLKLPAYDVVSKVAMAAEQISKAQSDDCITMEGTCRLVNLAKRTLLLLVVVVSILTIVGFLS